MSFEYIFIAIGVLTLVCNIVLIVYLIKDNRAGKAEYKSNTNNKSFIINTNQSNLVLENQEPKVMRSRDELIDTEIL